MHHLTVNFKFFLLTTVLINFLPYVDSWKKSKPGEPQIPEALQKTKENAITTTNSAATVTAAQPVSSIMATPVTTGTVLTPTQPQSPPTTMPPTPQTQIPITPANAGPIPIPTIDPTKPSHGTDSNIKLVPSADNANAALAHAVGVNSNTHSDSSLSDSEAASVVFWDTEYFAKSDSRQTNWDNGKIPKDILEFGAIKWSNPIQTLLGAEEPKLSSLNIYVRPEKETSTLATALGGGVNSAADFKKEDFSYISDLTGMKFEDLFRKKEEVKLTSPVTSDSNIGASQPYSVTLPEAIDRFLDFASDYNQTPFVTMFSWGASPWYKGPGNDMANGGELPGGDEKEVGENIWRYKQQLLSYKGTSSIDPATANRAFSRWSKAIQGPSLGDLIENTVGIPEEIKLNQRIMKSAAGDGEPVKEVGKTTTTKSQVQNPYSDIGSSGPSKDNTLLTDKLKKVNHDTIFEFQNLAQHPLLQKLLKEYSETSGPQSEQQPSSGQLYTLIKPNGREKLQQVYNRLSKFTSKEQKQLSTANPFLDDSNLSGHHPHNPVCDSASLATAFITLAHHARHKEKEGGDSTSASMPEPLSDNAGKGKHADNVTKALNGDKTAAEKMGLSPSAASQGAGKAGGASTSSLKSSFQNSSFCTWEGMFMFTGLGLIAWGAHWFWHEHMVLDNVNGQNENKSILNSRNSPVDGGISDFWGNAGYSGSVGGGGYGGMGNSFGGGRGGGANSASGGGGAVQFGGGQQPIRLPSASSNPNQPDINNNTGGESNPNNADQSGNGGPGTTWSGWFGNLTSDPSRFSLGSLSGDNVNGNNNISDGSKNSSGQEDENNKPLSRLVQITPPPAGSGGRGNNGFDSADDM